MSLVLELWYITMSDDNEFARYLAQYLHDFYSNPLNREEVELLIKQFMETYP